MKLVGGVATLVALALGAGCATGGGQRLSGGNPPADPRGVPVGGAAAGFRPQAVPNFYDATSLGSPGTGAFAGSGPAKLEQHREAVTGEPPPKIVPEIPPPPLVVAPPAAPASWSAPPLVVPGATEAAPPTPVAAPPAAPVPPGLPPDAPAAPPGGSPAAPSTLPPTNSL